MKDRCDTCHYYIPCMTSDDGIQWGECRRFPPAFVGLSRLIKEGLAEEEGEPITPASSFIPAFTYDYLWCGEWKEWEADED